jgi:hypothetical protein
MNATLCLRVRDLSTLSILDGPCLVLVWDRVIHKHIQVIKYTRECPFVITQVLAANVTVHTIAVTNAADAKMEGLARNTGGLSFFASDTGTSNAMNEAMATIGELNLSKHVPYFAL